MAAEPSPQLVGPYGMHLLHDRFSSPRFLLLQWAGHRGGVAGTGEAAPGQAPFAAGALASCSMRRELPPLVCQDLESAFTVGLVVAGLASSLLDRRPQQRQEPLDRPALSAGAGNTAMLLFLIGTAQVYRQQRSFRLHRSGRAFRARRMALHPCGLRPRPAVVSGSVAAAHPCRGRPAEVSAMLSGVLWTGGRLLRFCAGTTLVEPLRPPWCWAIDWPVPASAGCLFWPPPPPPFGFFRGEKTRGGDFLPKKKKKTGGDCWPGSTLSPDGPGALLVWPRCGRLLRPQPWSGQRPSLFLLSRHFPSRRLEDLGPEPFAAAVWFPLQLAAAIDRRLSPAAWVPRPRESLSKQLPGPQWACCVHQPGGWARPGGSTPGFLGVALLGQRSRVQ